MEKVKGIGGVFFVAKKPEGLSRWYSQYLGVDCAPPTYDAAPWRQDAGPAVFAPLPESTTYFGDARRTWIINFRVSNLDAMAAQLSAAGIKVDVDPELYPNGRFARLHDPEGNPIELWQPMGPDAG
jgi:catechol 2,3-dioxygenase-like lactoylglutathione lyase family enzyme